MRRLLLLLIVGVLQVALASSIAQAQDRSFSDGFKTFDSGRWGKSDHQMGHGYLEPSNVVVRRGKLAIKIPARTLNGGEIYSKEMYRYGGYGARLRAPYAPTSITGFFLYRSPDFEHEIDIEIYNDHSRRIMFTTYSNGSRTHTETMRLPFDATTGFHRYHFRYGPRHVGFYVDGKLMKKWRSGVPNEAMHLLINAWYPNWLGGKKAPTNRFLLMDWIRYRQL